MMLRLLWAELKGDEMDEGRFKRGLQRWTDVDLKHGH